MTRVLLTGMSGTGKSTVVGELQALGYKAVDVDQPGWSEHAPDGDWVWCKERIEEILASDDEREVSFVSGCASNQVQFYPRFDHVVLLSAPGDVIVERLRTRTNNPYGKKPDELAEVLRYLETVEPRLRRAATREVDASAPLEQVVTAVLRIANGEGTG